MRYLIFALLALAPVAALAQDDPPKDTPSAPPEDLGEAKDLLKYDRIRANGRKTFLKAERFSLHPFVGQTFNDPFFTRYAFGARASYHLVDSLALEAGGAFMVTADNEQTLKVVRGQLNAVTADNAPYSYFDAGFTFSPIYGKLAIANKWIIHLDAFVSAGVGSVVDTGDPAFHPAMTVGAGARVFVLDWLVVRADVRDYVYAQNVQGISLLQTLLMFNVGVEVYFPFDFEYKNVAFKIVE